MQQMNQEGMDMEMANASASAGKKESKGMMMGMMMCAVLAIAGIGFGVYEMLQANSAKQQIADLKVEIKKDDGTTTTLETDKIEVKEEDKTIVISDSAVTANTEDYIYIGEWGLKFKIPEGLHQVSYRIHNDSEIEGPWYSKTGVSSLIVEGYKNAQDSVTYSNETQNSSACASAWVVRVPVAKRTNGAPAFTIGEYDFYDGGWQSACMDTMPSDSRTGALIRDALMDSSNYSAI